jgi:23S rRNA (cytidine1920-2'-O)/16S rRNA (cytidine1409-2'-O)-methyltransferase
VQRGLAPSREKAQAAILAGDVTVDGETVTRPAAQVRDDADVAVAAPPRFVSRGGEKLDHALTAFGLDVRGAVALDVGASTGGFTDCLLQRGAAHVFAVDVGYGQLAYRLRMDPRVTVLERTNIRNLEALPGDVRATLATIDVSFISLTKVLGPVARLLEPGSPIVALVKPQFEARREEVRRGGVVRDPRVHAAVVGRVAAWAVERGFRIRGLTTSPLLGPAGNREFFLLLRSPEEPPGRGRR